MILDIPLRLEPSKTIISELHTLNMIYWFCVLCQELDQDYLS